MSITMSRLDSILTYSVQKTIINNVTLPIKCRNLSLSLHQTKKTHSHSQASTEADYPAARNGNIKLSPPHQHAIGSSSGLRLSDLPDLPDYQVRRYHMSVAAAKCAWVSHYLVFL